MRNSFFILVLFFIQSIENFAQPPSDSLYAHQIDSLIAQKLIDSFDKTKYTINRYEDSINFRSIEARYQSSKLVEIAYYPQYGSGESAVFHLIDDVLVLIEYRIADPDLYSEGPASINYKFFYKDNKVVYQSSWIYQGMPKVYDSISIDKKDFIKELDYYKTLLSKK